MMSTVEWALYYCQMGISIVPMAPATKRALVRWKELQDYIPTAKQVREWFARWPDAGIAAVQGLVSNLFVIDVDGPAAHDVLVERLGEIPLAPAAISGSREPDRYHLFFRHPDVATRAKVTPWHPTLEFRGGGLVVLPPSVHKSGHCYEWVSGWGNLGDAAARRARPRIAGDPERC